MELYASNGGSKFQSSSKRVKKLTLQVLLGAVVALCSGPCCRATMPVFDAALNTLEQVNWSLNRTMQSTFHAGDIAKYVQQIDNQVRQIINQYTQIANQVENLRRLGDPNYYVHMLNLDTLLGDR
jgi:conjugal transfer/entry exclusion protein